MPCTNNAADKYHDKYKWHDKYLADKWQYIICLSLFRFTSAQRAVYQSELNVQKACIDLCRSGTTLDAIYSAMALLFNHELYTNGILKEKPNNNEIYEVSPTCLVWISRSIYAI